MADLLKIDGGSLLKIDGGKLLLAEPLTRYTDWRIYIGLGPSEFNFVSPENKTVAPHSDSNCGYWWKGETYS